jgi:hypothetical protein
MRQVSSSSDDMTGELSVRTCENCGADAVDSRGVCQNCGFVDEADMRNSSPSLGETRAAEIPRSSMNNRGMGMGPSPAQPGATPQFPFERTVDMPRYTPPASRTYGGMPSQVGTSTQTGSSPARYCGTCGARIERGEVFCGQCGTPVGPSGNNVGSYGGRNTGSYMARDDDDVWSPSHGDALTEAMIPGPPTPMPAPYNRGVGGSPYSSGYSSATSYEAVQSARASRILWGILCLVASLMMAGVAGAVALLWK